MSFRIKTKVKTFKAIIAALYPITEETAIAIDGETLKCKAWDPSHFCAMSINWPKNKFDLYEVTADDKFGFRLDDMNNIMKRFSDKDADLEIRIDDDERILKLTSNEKQFQLKLIQNDYLADVPDELKVEYDVTFEMPLATFNTYMADIKVISEFMEMESKDGKMTLSCEGDSGRANVTILDGVTGDAKCRYNIDLMRGFLSNLEPFIEKVSVSFGTQKPARFRVYFDTDQYINFFIGQVQKQ